MGLYELSGEERRIVDILRAKPGEVVPSGAIYDKETTVRTVIRNIRMKLAAGAEPKGKIENVYREGYRWIAQKDRK